MHVTPPPELSDLGECQRNNATTEASFTKNKSPVAIIFLSSIIFSREFECHRQFLGQKIIAAGDLFLMKLATGQYFFGGTRY